MQRPLPIYVVFLLVSLQVPSFAVASLDQGKNGEVNIYSSGRNIATTEKPRYLADEIVFQFKVPKAAIQAQTASAAKVAKKLLHDRLRQEISRRHKLRDTGKLYRNSRREKLERVNRARVPVGKSVEDVLAELKADPDIEWAEPNYLRYVQTTPNDPEYFSRQHSIFSSMTIPAAWDATTGSSSVVVAVIDTGVDYTHPDLAGNIRVNTGEIAGDAIDNDGNGFVDDVRGWDFVDVSASLVYPGEDFGTTDNEPMDFLGHGTHVSGIIGAKGNNGVGISGVSWDVSIMPLRAGYKDKYGQGVLSVTAVGEALVYACDNGADIINMSYAALDPSTTENQALDYCAEKGVLLVAAAGNNHNSAPYYPAALKDVISVASVDSANILSYFSNFGPWVDIAAKGQGIYSTLVGGGYGYLSGTSMAAPVISGVAALVKSAHPELSGHDLARQLLLTGQNLNGVNSNYFNLIGAGLVQAGSGVGSLSADKKAAVVTTNAVEESDAEDGYADGGEIFLLKPSVRNFGGDLSDVSVELVVTDPYLTVLDAVADIGSIAAGLTVTSSTDTIRYRVEAGVPVDHHVDLQFRISDLSGIIASETTSYLVNPEMRNLQPIANKDIKLGRGYGDPRIIRYPDGGIHLLYNAMYLQPGVLARYRYPDGSWEQEKVIPALAGFQNGGGFHEALGPDDRLHVVFEANEGPWDNEILYTVHDPATRIWSEPVNLTTNAGIYLEGLTPLPEHAVVVDGSGNPHVVWGDSRNGYPEIYLRSYDGAQWSAEESIASLSYNSDFIDLLFDSDQLMTLIWRESNTGAGVNRIMMMQKVSGVWTVPVVVAPKVSGEIRTRQDSTGNIFISYNDTTTLRFRRFDGLSWLDLPLSGDTSVSSGYSFALDTTSEEKIQLTVPQGVTGGTVFDSQLFTRRFDGANWSLLSPFSFYPYNIGFIYDQDLLADEINGHLVVQIADDFVVNVLSSESREASYPTRPVVADEGIVLINSQTFTFGISSTHPSGVGTYRYSIGKAPGSNDILDWQETTSSSVVETIIPSLVSGQKYYINAMGLNNDGYWSPTGSSDGIVYCDADTNGDGICDPGDSDHDGVPDDLDICPGHDDAVDNDLDGVPDGCDSFPNDIAASKDTDSDGYPDSWNPGKTGADSTTGLVLDAFPADPTEHADADGDGLGDNGDPCPSSMPIRIVGEGSYWQGLQWVYDNYPQTGYTIQVQSLFINGPLVLDQTNNVTIQGGFSCDFTFDTGVPTSIESLIIGSRSGSVTIENFVID